MKRILELSVILLMLVLILLASCRKEQDPLDRNRAPNTILTSAPPETTEADYRVHLYWHGEDADGVVERYIWYITDTVMTLDPAGEPDIEILDWNPAHRLDDFLKGRFTHRKDTVIVFTGFDKETGVMLNRQAFHIAAIDDAGRMDENPARLQFFARVKGIPEVEFWTKVLDRESGAWIERRFDPLDLDTISMFTPFYIRFFGRTVNNMVTGYRWVYGGKVYPGGGDGESGSWYIPTVSPPETVEVYLDNRGNKVLPSATFYFKVIARDEAGAWSKSDISTGKGMCFIVVNHDPDTRILRGELRYTPQDGVPREEIVDFTDGLPDTLPYRSVLTLHYIGWEDPSDSLEFNDPPTPILFQFQYSWISGLASYGSPWYPTARAEDTNLGADEDSTTMIVGPYDYKFWVRAYDEQYRADGTPDSVVFFGNFPPEIDSMKVKFFKIPTLIDQPDNPTLVSQLDTLGNVLKIGIDPGFYDSHICRFFRQDTIMSGSEIIGFWQHYRYLLQAWGRDDYRDPPGSAIKGWMFSIVAEEDYYYRKEDDPQYDADPNYMQQLITFKVKVPYDAANPDTIYSVINDPPLYLGDQEITITGYDISGTEKFNEKIRCTSPVYDEITDTLIAPGEWCVKRRSPARYAGRDTWIYNIRIEVVQ